MVETLEIRSLFDELTEIDIGLTPQERFEKFHSENMHVYVELRKLALDLVDRGHEHIGIAMIWETLRYNYALRTKDASKFKLDNSLRAPYSRLLMANEPRLAGVFETRHSKHDG